VVHAQILCAQIPVAAVGDAVAAVRLSRIRSVVASQRPHIARVEGAVVTVIALGVSRATVLILNWKQQATPGHTVVAGTRVRIVALFIYQTAGHPVVALVQETLISGFRIAVVALDVQVAAAVNRLMFATVRHARVQRTNIVVVALLVLSAAAFRQVATRRSLAKPEISATPIYAHVACARVIVVADRIEGSGLSHATPANAVIGAMVVDTLVQGAHIAVITIACRRATTILSQVHLVLTHIGVNITLIEGAVVVVVALGVQVAAACELLDVLALVINAHVYGADVTVVAVGVGTTLGGRMLAHMVDAQIFSAWVSVGQWLQRTVKIAETAPGDRRVRAAHAGDAVINGARVGVITPGGCLAIPIARHELALVVQAYGDEERVLTQALDRCPAALKPFDFGQRNGARVGSKLAVGNGTHEPVGAVPVLLAAIGLGRIGFMDTLVFLALVHHTWIFGLAL